MHFHKQLFYTTFLLAFSIPKRFQGHTLANRLRLVVGVPGTFLVYWDERFHGTISWKIDGWVMAGVDPDLVAVLGEWIVVYYQ